MPSSSDSTPAVASPRRNGAPPQHRGGDRIDAPAALQSGYDEMIGRLRERNAWAEIRIRMKAGHVVSLVCEESAEDTATIA